MNFWIKKTAALAALVVLCAGGSNSLLAASVTYNLAYSSNATGHISGDPLLVTNDIPNDGTVYATVTIDNDGATGLVNFTVSVSDFWTGKQDTNFGIDAFGFNLTGSATGLVAADVINLPISNKWTATVDTTNGITENGLGMFDVDLTTLGAQGGPDRQNPDLMFSIDLGGDQSVTDGLLDYVADSVAGANGSFLFAVHLAGFLDQNPLDPVVGGTCTTPDANNPDCNLLTSAWFSTTAVPVPAAVWLFGSGLLGLIGVARRKAAA